MYTLGLRAAPGSCLPSACCPRFINITDKTPHTFQRNNIVRPVLTILFSPQPLASPREPLPAASSVITPSEPLYRAYLAALSCLFVSESPRRKQPLASSRALDFPVLPAPVPDHTGPARATLEQSTVNRTALASSFPSDQQVEARSPSDWTACLTFKRPPFLPEDPQISLDFPLFRNPNYPPNESYLLLQTSSRCKRNV